MRWLLHSKETSLQNRSIDGMQLPQGVNAVLCLCCSLPIAAFGMHLATSQCQLQPVPTCRLSRRSNQATVTVTVVENMRQTKALRALFRKLSACSSVIQNA